MKIVESTTSASGSTTAERAGAAFGHLAASYDEDFETLPAARRLRRLVWDIYLRYFNPGDSLLELNCGTGTDALALAEHGIRVHATDVSDEMLKAFEHKLRGSPQKQMITTQLLAFGQLHELQARTFAGVYSNMGGLNCESDLQRVAHDLHRLTKPGGVFVGTFLGDMAIWEMMAFLLRGDFKHAFRRRSRNGVLAHVGGSMIRTFYYSPKALAQIFSPHFVAVELVGLNIFTPPPTSQGAYRVFGPLMKTLEGVDERVMRSFPFNRIGDHFVIVLKHGAGA